MAKNWTIKEAYDAIKENNKSAVADFGKRFPLALLAVSKLSGAELLVEGLPEHMTMRKLDSALKDGVEPFEDDEAPAKESKPVPKKSGSGRRGRPPKTETKPEEVEEEVEESPYDGMGAVELFKLCKNRGITVQPKQKAAVYIELLKAEDKKAEEQDDEDDDDGWDDEEQEEKPAKKKSKTAPAKSKSKKSEPEDDDDDEDESEDSWDI